jgi:hypothetical protein
MVGIDHGQRTTDRGQPQKRAKEHRTSNVCRQAAGVP